MGLSTIALEQREKEEESLRSFLTKSLIASLAVHIVLLIFGSLWAKGTELVELTEDPIEVVVVDNLPSVEQAKPKENTQKTELKGGSKAGGGSGGAGGGSGGGSGTRSRASETLSTSSAPPIQQ